MLTAILTLLAIAAVPETRPAIAMDFIRVSEDRRGFVFESRGEAFVPWGFNYPAGERFQEEDWYPPGERLEADFREMRKLGANVVRVHLDMSLYMEAPDRPAKRGLDQLDRLLAVAEKTGLYLDITGLACYLPKHAMPWYDALSESDRWATQARFWEAIAERCANRKAVYCYDLINEPVVPGEKRGPGKWCSGSLFGGCDFVHFIALDPAGRARPDIAVAWVRQLSAAIRRHDRRHLITVGMLPSTPRLGHFSGFLPEKIAPEVDFLAVHVYPEKGKVDEAVGITKGFAAGKPLVIEETYALSCTPAELKEYVLLSRKYACGWIGHYGGERIDELEELKRGNKATIGQAIVYEGLKFFQQMAGTMKASVSSRPAAGS